MLLLICRLQIGVLAEFVIAVAKIDTWWMEVQGVQVCLQFRLIFVTLEQFLKELTLLVPSLLQHW